MDVWNWRLKSLAEEKKRWNAENADSDLVFGVFICRTKAVYGPPRPLGDPRALLGRVVAPHVPHPYTPGDDMPKKLSEPGKTCLNVFYPFCPPIQGETIAWKKDEVWRGDVKCEVAGGVDEDFSDGKETIAD